MSTSSDGGISAMRFILAALTVLMSIPVAVHADDTRPAYPPTRTDKVVEQLHGVKVPDPYRWLEDADAPEVKEWVEKENAFTRSVLDKVPGRAKIHERLNALLEIGSLGTPAPRRGRYFYTRR